MKTWLRCLSASMLLLSVYGFGCEPEDDELTDDPTLDLWCGEVLCDDWDSTGSIRRVGTWHKADFAVELGGRGASLSQRIERSDEVFECVDVYLQGRWSSESELIVEVDWDDDGSVEWSRRVPAREWKRWDTSAGSGFGYHGNLRIRVRLAGPEPAVLSEIRVKKNFSCTRDSYELDAASGCDDEDDAGCAGW